MPVIYLALLNSAVCRIYQFQKKAPMLTLIEELKHRESRLKVSEDLVSDKRGRYKPGMVKGRGAYEPRTDIKEIEFEHFAREIAKKLNQERVNNQFKNLIIVAPPHMQGLLMQTLNKNVKDLIIKTLEKDIVQFTPHELEGYLKEELAFVYP